MDVDSRRIRRVIAEKRPRERALDRVVRGQAWLDPVSEAIQRPIGADGRVLDGPATFDQPLLQVRERGGAVEVRLGHPLH